MVKRPTVNVRLGRKAFYTRVGIVSMLRIGPFERCRIGTIVEWAFLRKTKEPT